MDDIINYLFVDIWLQALLYSLEERGNDLSVCLILQRHVPKLFLTLNRLGSYASKLVTYSTVFEQMYSLFTPLAFYPSTSFIYMQDAVLFLHSHHKLTFSATNLKVYITFRTWNVLKELFTRSYRKKKFQNICV